MPLLDGCHTGHTLSCMRVIGNLILIAGDTKHLEGQI